MKLKAGQIALIGVPIAVGLYLIGRQIFKKDSNSIPAQPVVGGDIPVPPSGSGSQSFPLKRGSAGANVIRLQNALKKCNSSHLPRYGVDGKFGSETETALKSETGKTTITEAELTALEQKCNTASNSAVSNAQRVALANKHVADFKADRLKKFYAVWKTSGNVNGFTKIWEPGDYVGFFNNATFQVSPEGFITATEGTNKTYFSPYGVEVKVGALYPF